MYYRIFVALMLGIVSVSISTPTSAAQGLEPPRTLGTPLYMIQSNDVLSIFVWKEPNLTGKVTVRPDGRISFPLVQDMQASGLNPGQLKEQIEVNLKQYIDAPNVTVIVEAIQSYRVYVTGKVNKAGAIQVEKPITVVQALALAGGTQEFASLAEIVIIRNSGEDSTRFVFNYPEFIKGKNFSQNMSLRSGDTVIVP